MSPSQSNDHRHQNATMKQSNNVVTSSSPLKINKDSHSIKKSPPSSASSSSSSPLVVNGGGAAPNNAPSTTATRAPPRHPVIIYTHSPKVIHTNPKDFMALVQKLTGLNQSEEDPSAAAPPTAKLEPGTTTTVEKNGKSKRQNNNNSPDIKKGTASSCFEDNDESANSVITDENGCNNNVGDPHLNSSCYIPQFFDPPNASFNSMPFYNNNNDFLCSAPPFFNYSDSLLLMPNMMRSSLSAPTFDTMKDLSEF